MCYLWWTEWHWGKFLASATVSLADCHPTKYSALGLSTGAATAGQLVADVPNGLSLTSPHGTTGRD
jgi:hypothetical protein